ncbi:MAG: hypothetical protein ABI898_04760 [Sphingomonadales bacterium]
MKYILLVLPFLLTSPLAAKPIPTPIIEVRNIAGDWLTFWDAIRGQPTAERVAVFKRDLGVKFPDFYGIARFGGEVTEA